MVFKVGETVVYPHHGAALIQATETRVVKGEEKLYLVLKVAQGDLVKVLRSTREARYVLAANGHNDDLLYSMDWGSVLSNRWALEQALLRLVRAADGDPATDPNV